MNLKSSPHVEVTKDGADSRRERIDRTLEGNYRDGYRSFKHMYLDWHPDINPHEVDVPAAFIREAYMSRPAVAGSGRVTEAVTTGTFAEALGDSVTRRMVAEYGLPQLQNWRQIVSSIAPVNDFRTQRVDRIGGFGTLPTVAESANYTALTTPPDEEVTYAITKKGGTESLTFEAIANDDIRALTRIPVRLGRAAAQTIYRFVWDTLSTNPLIYDGVALFAAAHGNNTAAVALGTAGLQVARQTMRQQIAFGDASEVLGVGPRLVVVPAELEETAFELTNSAVAVTSNKDATVPNINQTLEHIVIPYFTDGNDWFAVADPAMVPTFELGFYLGREDPELFVQDDPRVGASFASDQVTWKIRHIYSGAVLDFRGFFRGTQV